MGALRACRGERRRRQRRTSFRAALAGALLAPLALGVALAPAVSLAQRPTPVNLQLAPGTGSLSASWGVANALGLTGFRIRWKETSGEGGGQAEVARAARAYAILGLRHVPYEVRVRALYYAKPGGLATGEATPLAGLEEPLEEQPPVEEPPEEEPPEEEAPEVPGEGARETPAGGGGEAQRLALVSASPTGPPTPASGWSVAYADGFGAPIGSGPGQDNTWFPNNCTLYANCRGFNTNEREVMNPSAVSETAQGLKLTCTHTSIAQEPGKKHFVCGTVRGQSAAGYSPFKWSPGKGQTLVFEAVAKWPPNTGEADPGWWSNGPPWNDTEVDFFEGGGASPTHTTGWLTDPLYTAWFASPHPTADKRGFSVDPSLAFHTYTFEIKPNNTYSVWIDGEAQSWAVNVGPVVPDLAEKATLIVSYGLRRCGCKSGFTKGTREFDVKSVVVYEDKAHKGVGIENGGLAPGTALG